MTTTINMLILKHFKQETTKSIIDIVLDREMTHIEGILSDEFERQFQKVYNEKNTYRMDSTPGDLMVLDLMKCLRKRHWILMTSHSFVHLSLDKTMETHFYFERILNPNNTNGNHSDILPLSQLYRSKPFHESDMLEEEKSSYINSRINAHFGTSGSKIPGISGMNNKPREEAFASKPMPAPEVMALILDKSSTQSRPYGFAKRQTLLTAQHPRLRREANGKIF